MNFNGRSTESLTRLWKPRSPHLQNQKFTLLKPQGYNQHSRNQPSADAAHTPSSASTGKRKHSNVFPLSPPSHHANDPRHLHDIHGIQENETKDKMFEECRTKTLNFSKRGESKLRMRVRTAQTQEQPCFLSGSFLDAAALGMGSSSALGTPEPLPCRQKVSFFFSLTLNLC